MNTIIIGTATSSISSSGTIPFADDAASCVRRWVNFARSACASAIWRLHRAASGRREALDHALQEFVLELLAAVVLIAIFLIVTDPTTRGEPESDVSGVRSSS